MVAAFLRQIQIVKETSMFVQEHYLSIFLSPASRRRYITYINIYISFIPEDIFTKFAGNVYGMTTYLCKILASFEKQNGCADCLKITKIL